MITFFYALCWVFVWIFCATLGFALIKKFIDEFSEHDVDTTAKIIVAVFLGGPIALSIIIAIRLGFIVANWFSEDDEFED